MIELGPQTNKLLDATQYNAEKAARLLNEHMAAIAGRDFFGETGVHLVWEAGQLTEVRTDIKRAER